MQLQYSPKALEDLQRIRESILEKFDDENIANDTLKQITTAARGLELFPYKGVELRKISGIATDYRYLFCKKNYLFYRVEKELVRVVRILNEKQDYMRILFGISEVMDDE